MFKTSKNVQDVKKLVRYKIMKELNNAVQCIVHCILHYTIAHTALLCLLYLLVHHNTAITTYFALWHYSTRRVQILIKKMHHGDNINWLHSILKHFCVGDLVVWVWTRIRYNIYLEISFIWVFWWLLRKKAVWCSSDLGLGFSDVSYKLNCFLRHVLMPSFPSFLCKLFAGDTDVPLCQLSPAILHLHHCWPSNNHFQNLILLPPF